MPRSVPRRPRLLGGLFDYAIATPAPTIGPGLKFTDPWWAEMIATANPMLGGATTPPFAAVPANGAARIGAVLARIAEGRAAFDAGYVLRPSVGGSALLAAATAADMAHGLTVWADEEAARRAASQKQQVTWARAAGSYVGGKAFGDWFGGAIAKMNEWAESLVGEGTSHPAGTRAAYDAAATALIYIAGTIGVWPPLNVLNVTAFGNAWEDSQLARDIAGDIRDRWLRMDPTELAPVRAAWAATLAHSDDERVRDALRFSPWSAQGLADDTMVYLAALGPALEAGRDPRDVAVELWTTSRGLADPLVATRIERLEGSPTQSNAAEMLWAVLARDAWTIMEAGLPAAAMFAAATLAAASAVPTSLQARATAAPAQSTGARVAIGVGSSATVAAGVAAVRWLARSVLGRML